MQVRVLPGIPKGIIMIDPNKPIEYYEDHSFANRTLIIARQEKIEMINARYGIIKTDDKAINYDSINWKTESVYHIIDTATGYVVCATHKGKVRKFLKDFERFSYFGGAIYYERDGNSLFTIVSTKRYINWRFGEQTRVDVSTDFGCN